MSDTVASLIEAAVSGSPAVVAVLLLACLTLTGFVVLQWREGNRRYKEHTADLRHVQEHIIPPLIKHTDAISEMIRLLQEERTLRQIQNRRE